ncbi:MAG: type II toxin-antitoxin system PemK/MazF family toxin [Actinobacteria bacterium]|nr:type II toxin-antitoxin system PemK/MazF family toxin [Actinomycetota bacterium]
MVRGEIFRFRGTRDARGSEQRGAPYAVVVQADELLPLSTVLVVPTSASAPARTYRPSIEVEGRETRLLTEQLTATSTSRLGASVGRLDSTELFDLDRALAIVLGL